MKTKTPTVESLLAIIEAQAEMIKKLQMKVAELERRLNKNSRNSSKPPSSDGLSKLPRTTSLREKGRHKNGGQAGHKGETLKQTATPDAVVRHAIINCPDCGGSLESSISVGEVSRQVFDIPHPKYLLLSIRAEVKTLPMLPKESNQHHLRELTALIEHEKEAWAKKMRRFLRCALRYRHRYGEKQLTTSLLVRLHDLYDRIIREGLLYHEANLLPATKKKRGRIANRTGHNLLIRLNNYREDVLRFLHDPMVPFTNNLAERDLRMMKCKQKISRWVSL